MGRGKHIHKAHGAKRKRYSERHPRPEGGGGGKPTRFKRNVKQAGMKRRLEEKWKI